MKKINKKDEERILEIYKNELENNEPLIMICGKNTTVIGNEDNIPALLCILIKAIVNNSDISKEHIKLALYLGLNPEKSKAIEDLFKDFIDF